MKKLCHLVRKISLGIIIIFLQLVTPLNTSAAPDSFVYAQSGCSPSITVVNNADSGPGSLREAVVNICSGGVITFDNDYTITLTSEIEIYENMTINGAGHHITISGGNITRILYVGNVTVTLRNLTISNGSSVSGGSGMYIYNGTVNLISVTISNNTTTSPTYSGGGIYNYNGYLSINSSTFSGNHSLGNDTYSGAGAIYNDFGTVLINNSTFVGNTALDISGEDEGGALYNFGNVSMTDTLIVGNSPANCGSTKPNSSLSYHNLTDDDSCGTNPSFENLPEVDLLGPLGDYGGPTPTIPLLPGSPAINRGSTLCPPIDQRGITRDGSCDIGAFESRGFTLSKTNGDNQSAQLLSSFSNPLEVSVTANQLGEPVNGGNITFTSPISGGSAILATSPATISSGTASVIATANDTIGTYNVNAETSGAIGISFSLTNTLTYYTVTFNANLGSGTMSTQVASAPTALTTNTFTRTSYDFAGWNTASNGTGTAYSDGTTYNFGSDITLFAQWNPVAPSAFSKANPADAVISVSNSPTLSWSASSGQTGYEYCMDTSTSGACTGTWISSGNSTSAALTGLDHLTTYRWQVRAENAGLYTYANAGTLWSFTTIAQAPTVDSNPATNITSTGATMNASVNAEGESTAVTFEYGTTPMLGTTVTAAESPVTGSTDTQVTYALSGLLPHSTYFYQVNAQNSGGTSTSDRITFTTNAQAPSVTTNPASVITTDSATLNGTVNAEGNSTTVTFEYGTSLSYGSAATAAESPVTGSTDTMVTYTLTGLLPNTEYHYRVRAQNNGGTSFGVDQSFTTSALGVTIQTTFHNTSHTPVTVAAMDELLHVSATITPNGSPDPTGSVSFTTFANPACAGTGVDAGTLSLQAGGIAEPSQSAQLTENGLSFRAHYNGDSNYPAVNGSCVSISTVAFPTVLTLSLNTIPQDGAILTTRPSELRVQFNSDILHGDPLDPNSGDNPANYLLVEAGENGTFQTQSCDPQGNGGWQPDDRQITVNSVDYDSSTFRSTLTVNGGQPLPRGSYLLLICGTTSISDPDGTLYLNNHLADSRILFSLAAQPGPAKNLPATGFAPHRTTLLPHQPAALANAGLEMQIAIPSLRLETSIVGVPGPAWDVTWLGEQIGYLDGTAFPTWNGNSVLTGHVTNANGLPGPFAELGALSYGDQVFIHAWGQDYTYEVRTVDLQVKPDSTRYLTRHEELPWLTLITCRGYDEATNTYRWRTVVRAVLVSIE